MTDALLARVPVCESSSSSSHDGTRKSTLMDAKFDIDAHVDAMYVDDVARLQRICKEECLAEELARIENRKRTFIELYYKHLQGFVDMMLGKGYEEEQRPCLSYIPNMRCESRHTIPQVMQGAIDKDDRMVAHALALRVFTSDLRRKNYMVHVSYHAKNDGPHLALGETIEIRL